MFIVQATGLATPYRYLFCLPLMAELRVSQIFESVVADCSQVSQNLCSHFFYPHKHPFLNTCIHTFGEDTLHSCAVVFPGREGGWDTGVCRGRIFSCLQPSYEQAVSNLDRSMNISLWVSVAHSAFTEGSHMTKNMASGLAPSSQTVGSLLRTPLSDRKIIVPYVILANISF
jgi:hypothetical protein